MVFYLSFERLSNEQNSVRRGSVRKMRTYSAKEIFTYKKADFKESTVELKHRISLKGMIGILL
jgi:hypothetical protein